MPIKMKQCDDCNSLCSNSASKCHKCGSRNLAKGTYTTKQEAQRKQQLETTKYSQREVIQCSICYSPIPIRNGQGYCVKCDDDININLYEIY